MSPAIKPTTSIAHTQAEFAALLPLVADGGLMVRTDSRQVQPGEVFVAIPGSRVNGAEFIPQALENGAAWVVTRNADHWPQGDAGTARLVLHPEPARALGELAAAYFSTAEADLMGMLKVGVTGTNGKTTVAHIVEHMLAVAGRTPGMLGTVSYRWPGVELESSMTTPDCWKLHELVGNMRIAGCHGLVMEVSSHALDQDRVAGLHFDVGVMTNLTQDHLDYHGDMQSYYGAKKRLFTDYAATSGVAVLCAEDEWCVRLAGEVERAVVYGIEISEETLAALPESTLVVRGSLTRCDATGIAMDVVAGSTRFVVESGLVGRYNALNLLAGVGVGLAGGLPNRHVQAVGTFPGVPGRLERVVNNRRLDVFVDYAHTPDALENVLAEVGALVAPHKGRVICVFGCGGDRDRTKRPLMAEAVARHAHVAVLTSDNPRSEAPLEIMAEVRPGLHHARQVLENPDRRAAIAMALDEARSGDVVVIAGKGHETYQEVNGVRHAFHDVAVAEALLGGGVCA